MDVMAIPGGTFLRVTAPDSRSIDPHTGRSIAPDSREKLLLVDSTGVNAGAAISRGLPEESGWITGKVTLDGHWPGAPRLRLERTSPSPGGQAVSDSTVFRYVWANAGWVREPTAQLPPAFNEATLCGDLKRYNGIVRASHFALSTGDQFVIGNFQWLGRMAPT